VGGTADRVQGDVIKNNALEGFNHNAVEIAGPATWTNLIRGNTSVGAPLVGIEADKGASYNTYVDNLIHQVGEHAAVIISAMRDQGYPNALGDHIATGNVFRRNLISGVFSDHWAGGIYLSIAQDGVFEDNFIRDVSGSAANKSAAIMIDGTTIQNYTRSGNQTANVANTEWVIP